MTQTKQLTYYVTNFVHELVQCGLENVVISPGSRSTPLAMTMCKHKSIKEWIVIDERSAAFFALGMAQKTKKPVALVCTSGTAAANYFPAIVEAYHNRIPLLVLTTDRPHELRDIGAPQAIDQIKMFGNYVKWFKEMMLPEASDQAIHDVKRTAVRAMSIANHDNPGPVHLNFPFREPLIPDFSMDEIKPLLKLQSSHKMNQQTFFGEKQLSERELNNLLQQLKNKKRGLFVVGPQINDQLKEAVTHLAELWHVPILADPLSQLRSGAHSKENIIYSYDAILRDESIRCRLKPDYIVRFGAMPISKMYLFYAETHANIPQFTVEDFTGYRQPTEQVAQVIYADAVRLCKDLINHSQGSSIAVDKTWLERWQQKENIAKKYLFDDTENELTEGTAVRELLKVIPDQSHIYIGNSMAVRDLDTFFKATEKEINVLGNRGVNGIDGVVSSSIGAATTEDHMTLIIGDLSFYHDLNGLLAIKHYDINLTVLLLNNDGGGIFSFLPQAKDETYFEKLFGTPLNIEFAEIIKTYGGTHAIATTLKDLEEQLLKSYATEGLSVVEVQTNRDENAKWHRQKWQQINDDLLKLE